jgi:hypothetical protein
MGKLRLLKLKALIVLTFLIKFYGFFTHHYQLVAGAQGDIYFILFKPIILRVRGKGFFKCLRPDYKIGAFFRNIQAHIFRDRYLQT